MRSNKILVAVALVGVLLLAVGCGAAAPTSEVEQIKLEICACEDAECAAKIVAALRDLQSKYSRFEDSAAAQEFISRATICAVKLDPELAERLSEEIR